MESRAFCFLCVCVGVCVSSQMCVVCLVADCTDPGSGSAGPERVNAATQSLNLIRWVSLGRKLFQLISIIN